MNDMDARSAQTQMKWRPTRKAVGNVEGGGGGVCLMRRSEQECIYSPFFTAAVAMLTWFGVIDFVIVRCWMSASFSNPIRVQIGDFPFPQRPVAILTLSSTNPRSHGDMGNEIRLSLPILSIPALHYTTLL